MLIPSSQALPHPEPANDLELRADYAAPEGLPLRILQPSHLKRTAGL